MAKPPFDLTDPRIQHVIDVYKKRAFRALEIASAKDAAVRPVYALRRVDDRVEQVGTCVLLSVADKAFALSASHVFDSVGDYQLLIGLGTRLHSLEGERFSSLKGPSGTHRDDPVDASVFHMTKEVKPEMRACALTLADLDLIRAAPSREFHVISGYRTSISRSTSRP